MPNASLGPWGKWYASTEEDTAHYTDRQFRAWAGIFGLAVRGRGEVPKIVPLRARYGDEAIDFLIAEGRLKVRRGGRVDVAGWATYQAKQDTGAADRVARMRARRKAEAEALVTEGESALDSVEAVDPPSHAQVLRRNTSVTPTSVSTSTSSSLGREERARDFDLDAWAALSTLVDGLTGHSYSLRQPTGGLGAQALEMVGAFGLERTTSAIRRASIGLEKPDARQLIFGANGLLRPIPNAKDARARDEAERERTAGERRRADTQRLLDEQRAYDAEVGVASPASRVHDGPTRVGAIRADRR